jgi:hypothetical protein
MPKNKRWNVTFSSERVPKDVVKNLTKAGFAVEQVFDEIGVATGVASQEVADKLRLVPGVAGVEAEIGIDIGPPDAPIV